MGHGTKPRICISAGDIDGLLGLGLGLNNLIEILLIISLCRGVLRFTDSLLFGRILPATGICVVLDNLAYARQAKALPKREQREDCTALPHGVNTVRLFAFVFLLMFCPSNWQPWIPVSSKPMP